MSWLYTAANLAWSIVALLLRFCAAAGGSGGKAAGNPSVKAATTSSESSLPASTQETLLGVSPSDYGDSLDRDTSDFVKFIQTTVIPNFFRQRDKGHSEFAVLFLPKAETLSSICQVGFLPQKPLVRRKQPFYPTVNQGHVNYMVARPDQDSHCEANLLRHLPALWSSCKRRARYTPTHVVLYTWIQPCSACTAAIVRSLSVYPGSTLPTRANLVIAYTVRWKRVSDEENERNRRRLVDSGVRVVRVKYAVDL